MTLTGTKMNPQNWGEHRERPDVARVHPAAVRDGGVDELVECEDCGWTWWVHHA